MNLIASFKSLPVRLKLIFSACFFIAIAALTTIAAVFIQRHRDEVIRRQLDGKTSTGGTQPENESTLTKLKREIDTLFSVTDPSPEQFANLNDLMNKLEAFRDSSEVTAQDFNAYLAKTLSHEIKTSLGSLEHSKAETGAEIGPTKEEFQVIQGKIAKVIDSGERDNYQQRLALLCVTSASDNDSHSSTSRKLDINGRTDEPSADIFASTGIKASSDKVGYNEVGGNLYETSITQTTPLRSEIGRGLFILEFRVKK